MNGLQEMVLTGEIVLQSKIAKRAAERLRRTHDHFDHVETWCSIQSILISVGIVSKILWPDKKYRQHGVELRQLLKVDETNPLSNRSFRNHFAHYDERVHEYFKFNSQGVYTDLAMNPHLNSGIFGHVPMYTHRGYNTFNNTIVFRDEILDLTELLIALDALLENCKPYTLV